LLQPISLSHAAGDKLVSMLLLLLLLLILSPLALPT
jgi:hypothetical protein